MGVTDQGAREARYAEAIHHATEQATLGWPQESLRLFVEPILREVLAVADAEVAAAVSEAQAEMRAKWAADVANVQAVALAQRNDAVVYRAEVERLREGIRALAAAGEGASKARTRSPSLSQCHATSPEPSASHSSATTGEDDEPLPDYLKELQRPTPASSGEAETGEAACGKDLGDTYVCRCLLDRGHSGMHQCRHFAGPAPVVTPSAEGSE